MYHLILNECNISSKNMMYILFIQDIIMKLDINLVMLYVIVDFMGELWTLGEKDY